MGEIKGTETEKNLLKAFAGEAAAGARYYIFAKQAKLEGYDYISKTFEDFANNEKEHAKIWYKWLNNTEFPKTIDNLKSSIKNERFESSDMYLSFAKKAKEEGFESLSELFTYVASVEKDHEEKLSKLISAIKNKNLAPDEKGEFTWECSACGCTIKQKEQPDYCPLCDGEDIFFFKIPV